MEVKIENNPMIDRIWNEWIKQDKVLSQQTKEERLRLYEGYQWLYPKKKIVVDLESQYGVHQKSNREEFKKWFYVVSGHLLSKVHLGENSYYSYMSNFKKLFKRDKVTSKDFPSQVLMVLAMLGYITGLKGGYSYCPGSDKSHGYPFIIDKEKLLDWGTPATSEGFFMSVSNAQVPVYVMTQTSSISFYEKGEDDERASWTQHPDWLSERQYQSISSIEVLEEGVKQSSGWIFNFNDYKEYCSLSEEEKDEITEDWISYQKLRDLSCHIIGGCKVDSYAGRFYSPLTNMRSDHRHKYLRLGGELVSEVDVSSAQPTFFGLLMYQETGVMSEWLRQSLNGTFYEWVRTQTSSKVDRKQIKKWVMQYLYSCYQPSKGKDYDNSKRRLVYGNKDKKFREFHKRMNRFLKENEPAIYKKIDEYKRNPLYNDSKEKWCSLLPQDLGKIEVKYIKACIHTLPEDIQFWTIHDCICVKESRSQEVKQIMEDVSREMFGFTLKLKIENNGEKYS